MQSSNKFKPYKKQEYLDVNYKINSKKETSEFLRRTFRDLKSKIIKDLNNDNFNDLIYAKPYGYFH